MMQKDQEANKEELEFVSDNTHIEEELKEAAIEIEQNHASANQEEIVSEVDKLNAELASVQDKYLRLYSEFENYKRRTTKERKRTRFKLV